MSPGTEAITQLDELISQMRALQTELQEDLPPEQQQQPQQQSQQQEVDGSAVSIGVSETEAALRKQRSTTSSDEGGAGMVRGT